MIEIGDGERITGDDTLGITLLVDVEHIAIASVRWDPGGGVAPPLHFHSRHAECFFVVEGDLTFRLEDREHRAGAETFVHVPPDVVHTFSVTDDSRAHFLDIHAPSCRFGDFVRGLYSAQTEHERRAARDAFDQFPAPEYASADPGLVALRRTGGLDGEAITDRPGRRATLLVDTDELTVSEFAYASGERGAQLHVHHHHADAFLVVEGELSIKLREGALNVPAGTFVLIPPGVVHGFDNDGSATMRCFNFHAPSASFGDYLRGRNPDFDQHDPPADGGADPASIVAVRLG